MKKWTSLVSLCALILGFQCYSQESENKLAFEVTVPAFSESTESIIEHTASMARQSTLLQVLRATNLDEVLSYRGAFTVFAPTNVAFEKLSNITFDKLLDPKNKKALKSILSYHIIAGKFSASSILRAMCRGNGQAMFTTIQGEKITASMNGLDIILTDKFGNQATILTADSNQSNGVIHEIDTVFLPVKLL